MNFQMRVLSRAIKRKSVNTLLFHISFVSIFINNLKKTFYKKRKENFYGTFIKKSLKIQIIQIKFD